MKKNIVVILFLVLSACSNIPGSNPNANSTELAATTTLAPLKPTIESPQPGMCSITGILILPNGTLLSRTPVYITPGKGPDNHYPIILVGPNTGAGDYFTSTDDNARFVIKNVIPGVYYLVASSTNNYSFVLQELEPLQIRVSPNELLELGNLYVVLD